LPEDVIQFYVDTGFDELYPPQVDAIQRGILDGKNTVAAIPTASGKTLLAELVMLKSVLNGGKAIYIVPLRALASEKYDRFSQFSQLGIKVGISTGDFDSKDEWLGRCDIIITTSEKADSLLRNEAGWMDGLTVIVADEIHLVNSPNRGPTLEMTLAKLMKLNPRAQILALSATIGNADEMAKWLDAELVQSDWRPVELREGILFGKAIDFINTKKEVAVDNKDNTIALSVDVIKDGGQCLIFTNTRKRAEETAKRVGRAMKDVIDADKNLTEMVKRIRDIGETDLCDKLAFCVENGTAFHHAGLRSEHRRIIEDGFKSNVIKAIACTPTLAAGLNLPARRVIIQSYKRYDAGFGLTPIPVLEYKQMCGRAGRPGLDPYGESVLIARNFDERSVLMENYVLAGPEDIWSKLGTENALRTHILSTIATGFASSRTQLLDFMDNTFYAFQQERWGLESVIDKVLEFLEYEDMVVENDDGLRSTPLGRLVSRLYIDPLSASIVIKGLQTARKITPLTLIHLICSTPDMRKLYLRSGDYAWVEAFATQHHREFVPLSTNDYEWHLAEVKTSMMFLDWIDELHENDITRRFGIGPGDIRALAETAEWLMHGTAELSAFLKLPHTRDARRLVQRIRYGIKPELLELTRLRGIGRARARRLYNAGYTDLGKLKRAGPKKIAKLIGAGVTAKVMEQLGE